MNDQVLYKLFRPVLVDIRILYILSWAFRVDAVARPPGALAPPEVGCMTSSIIMYVCVGKCTMQHSIRVIESRVVSCKKAGPSAPEIQYVQAVCCYYVVCRVETYVLANAVETRLTLLSGRWEGVGDGWVEETVILCQILYMCFLYCCGAPREEREPEVVPPAPAIEYYSEAYIEKASQPQRGVYVHSFTPLGYRFCPKNYCALRGQS